MYENNGITVVIYSSIFTFLIKRFYFNQITKQFSGDSDRLLLVKMILPKNNLHRTWCTCTGLNFTNSMHWAQFTMFTFCRAQFTFVLTSPRIIWVLRHVLWHTSFTSGHS